MKIWLIQVNPFYIAMHISTSLSFNVIFFKLTNNFNHNTHTLRNILNTRKAMLFDKEIM